MNLDLFVEKRLRAKSRATGVSLSKLVEFALIDYLEIKEEFNAELDRRDELMFKNRRNTKE